MLGATRRAPPRLPGLTEHQRHEARRRNITGAWTWEQAAWPSTPRTWLSQNHVCLHVPTTWPRSTSEKVPPWMTTTAWWPPGGDRQSRVRAGLSLLRVLPAAQSQNSTTCTISGTEIHPGTNLSRLNLDPSPCGLRRGGNRRAWDRPERPAGPLTAPRGAWTPLGHATPWGVVSRSLRCTKQHLATTTPKRID